MRQTLEISLPPHVHRVKARNKFYYYYSPGRSTKNAAKRQRIPGCPSDPEWWETYTNLANLPSPKINTNSFDYLIASWQASLEWSKLKPRTQEEFARSCRTISEAWGNLEVGGPEPKHVLDLRDAYRDTPAKANNLVRVLSAMIGWSIPRGYRSDNPCVGTGIKPLSLGEGYEPWPWEVIERARTELRPDLWVVAAVALYTGQRQSDVLSMRRNALRDGMISVVQQKTGKALQIPIHTDLWPVLKSIDHHAITICANTKGQPWTVSGFKCSWRNNKPEFLKEAGLVFHGLRKTAVCTLLEAGCTDAQVSAITGHSREMLVHYGKRVDQEKLARSAMQKWEAKN